MEARIVENERVVTGNRDMMLAAFPGRQPQVTAGLPRDFVAEAPAVWQDPLPKRLSVTSSYGSDVNRHSASKHLVPDKMQTAHLRSFSLIEMAIHGVANLLTKRVQSVRLGKD